MPQLQREDVHGAVIRRSGREITPVARVTRIAWHGGVLEWHHPLAVEVAGERMGELMGGGGTQPIRAAQRIAIHDTTRRAVLVLLLASLASSVALAAATRWVRQRQPRQRARR